MLRLLSAKYWEDRYRGGTGKRERKRRRETNVTHHVANEGPHVAQRAYTGVSHQEETRTLVNLVIDAHFESLLAASSCQ